MTEVNQRMARAAYEQGRTVYLLPSRMKPEGLDYVPLGINRLSGMSFETILKRFREQNCSEMTGKHVKCYMK